MRERGDYVVPYFNNKYRFDKPPFIYWTQMASYRLFGENDFAARLPSGVAAALTAVLLFAWGRRLGSERIGWWAADHLQPLFPDLHPRQGRGGRHVAGLFCHRGVLGRI